MAEELVGVHVPDLSGMNTDAQIVEAPSLPIPPQLISQEYRDLQTAFHRERPDYGISGTKHLESIRHVAQVYGVRSLLDYGCGKQTLIEALRIAWARGYDPCVPGLDGPPQPAEFVVCTDVLEHIEPDCLEAVLDHIRALTLRIFFVSVSLVPAKKVLPNGRNTHLIIQPAAWWLWRLLARWEPDTIRCNEREMTAVLRVPGEAARSPEFTNNVRK